MTHPITPPPELVRQWIDLPLSEEKRLLAAYRAGADQELEACCKHLSQKGFSDADVNRLHATRRPSNRPPTADELIKLAEAMRGIAEHGITEHEGRWLDELERTAQLLEQQSRAIEALPDDPAHALPVPPA